MNINIKKRLVLSSVAAAMSLTAWAQDVTVSGKVVDANGQPIAGATVVVAGTTQATVTDFEGKYSLSATADKPLNFAFIGYKSETVNVVAGQNEYNVVLTADENSGSQFLNQELTYGAFKNFSRSENTASVSVISNETIDKRSAKNIGNDILGQGNGLISLDGAGTYFNQNPTFYVRGLQSRNENAPLYIVDGVEREITTIVPSDVKDVQILKDAAAVALYGYKGANGVVLINTKRGQYNAGNTIKWYADFGLRFDVDRPEFVDAPTYARARNEALALEGAADEYSAQDIAAYESKNYPYLFPNVDWVDETFKDVSTTRRYNVEFAGGGKRFRYFTSLSLLANDGFINNDEDNDGYSTQDMYSRGNLRSNLDIKLTDYTDLQINLTGVLSEMQKPAAAGVDIWNLVYSTPSLAFPVKTAAGVWGGTSVWNGTINPVAMSSGAGYYKIHERALYADVIVDQSLDIFLEGLKLHGRLAYDNYSTLYEDRTQTFVYGKQLVTGWAADGTPTLGDIYSDGTATELATGANTNSWSRRAMLMGGVSFDRQLTDNQKLFAQVRWDYDFSDATGVNTTLHRQNITWYSHYGLFDRYFVDIALDASGSNRLAPDHKWAFSPTVSAAWVISNEDFFNKNDILNFLKLRASFGKITTDWLPDGSWTYYTQSYSRDSAYYPFGSDYSYGETASRASLGRMATENPTTEKSYKLNIGLDARLFNGLDLELDFYRQVNKDGWEDGAGAYSSVISFEAPYANEGEYKSYGFEAAANYNKKFGEVDFNLGGRFNLNKNEIVNMAEEPRAYENLVRTGDPINSIYGLHALGLFKDQNEIDNSPAQTFTTTRPGDIKYEDVNQDGVVDANDVVKLGYSNSAPEIAYSFNIGAEWKGIGLNALFNGVARYSAILNTAGYYWGLYGNTNLSQEVYDGRWTPENLDAKYPRLSASTNANNYQTSDFWIKDRNYLKLRHVELYYDFKHLLQTAKVIHGARFYVRGVDLFTKDDIDNVDAASYGATAPLTRSVVFGFSMQF